MKIKNVILIISLLVLSIPVYSEDKTLENVAIYKGEYEGPVVNGKPHGKGVIKSLNGNRYEGDFVDGQATGKGKLFYKDGDYYEGDFKDYLAHGKGKYYFNDGALYNGDWKKDNIEIIMI